MTDPQSFSSVRIHRSRFEYRALELVSTISPSPKLGIVHHFFMDSLFFKEYFAKISNLFSTGSTNPQSFSSVKIHRSMFEYGALGLVSIISPTSELGIMHCFFYGLIVLQGIFFQNLKYFLNRLDQSPKFQFSQNSLEHV